MTSLVKAEPKDFKIGLLIPWTTSEELDFGGRTSASAVSLAIDAVHNNTELRDNIRLR